MEGKQVKGGERMGGRGKTQKWLTQIGSAGKKRGKGDGRKEGIDV